MQLRELAGLAFMCLLFAALMFVCSCSPVRGDEITVAEPVSTAEILVRRVELYRRRDQLQGQIAELAGQVDATNRALRELEVREQAIGQARDLTAGALGH